MFISVDFYAKNDKLTDIVKNRRANAHVIFMVARVGKLDKPNYFEEFKFTNKNSFLSYLSMQNFKKKKTLVILNKIFIKNYSK